MANNIVYRIEADVSQLVAQMNTVMSSLNEVRTNTERVQEAQRLAFLPSDVRNFANELVNTNKVVAEQRELLKQLENYERFLKEARGRTNDTTAVERYNAELARTRATMAELRKVGGEALTDLRLTTDGIPSSAKKANEGYLGLTNTVVGLATAYISLSGISDFAKNAITAANNYEQVNIAFTTMLKSKAQADDLQAKIIELAAKTPYELPQLQETTKKLSAYGFGASEIIPTLTSIGDIAAGVGLEKLPQITNALGKMHAANRMMLSDVNSLTKAGINILAELETVTGKSGAALRKYISQGNVTYQVAYDALMRIGKTDFGGLMEKQSQTVSGLFSTLKDNATQASKTIGDGINEKLKDVIRYWTDFLSRTSQDDLKKWGDRIGAVAVAISVLVANLINLAPSLIAMLAIVKLVQEWNNFDTAVKKWNETATGTKGHIAFLQSGFKGLWATISANPIGAIITAFAMLLPVAQLVYEKLTALSEREKELNENIKSVVGSTSIQMNESNKLFAIIKDGTSTKEQYSGAVKKVLELSKEHGLGIETEQQLISDLTTAQKLLNVAIVENAIARQKAIQQQKITDEVILNETKIAELERKQRASGSRQIYNAETGETETYDPYQAEIDKLQARSKAVADKGAQTIQDIGNSAKEATKILNASLKEPFGELNTQISITQKQSEKAASALEIKRKEIETRAKGATDAQKRSLANELKPFEIEAERLQNAVKKAKAELNRDKDAAVGIGGKKHVDAENMDAKASKKTENDEKRRENDEKRRENERFAAKQKTIELDIKFEKDATEKKKMQAKKDYDDYIHSLQKFHKDKAITDAEFRRYSEHGLNEYNDRIASINDEKLKADAKATLEEAQKIENESIARQKRATKLIADDREKSLKESEVTYDEAKIKAGRELKDNQAELNKELLALETEFQNKKFEINQSFDKKELEAKYRIEKEKLDISKQLFEQGEVETRAAFEKSNPNKRQRDNFERLEARNKQLFQLEMHRAELRLEKEHQVSLAKIGVEGSSARVQILDAQIKSINAQIETVKITPLQNKEGKKFDIWRDVFGLDSEDGEDKKRIEAVKKAGDELAKLANQYLATQLKNAEKNLKIHDDAVKKAEDRVKKEQELKDKGFANDVAGAEKALSKENEFQAQALAEKQKVQKQQLVLESIGQFSSLVSASANIFETMSTIPFVGIPLAIATIATMFGSFAIAKADAWNSITKYRDGGKIKPMTDGIIQGRSHDEGGEKFLVEGEGGEWIVKRKQSKKFDDELNAINSDDESELKRLMFKRFAHLEPVPKFQGSKVVQIFETRNNEQIAIQKENEAKNNESIQLQKEANKLLNKILSEMPAETTDLGDFVQKKKGNRVETIRKFNKVA